jgi:FHA domain
MPTCSAGHQSESTDFCDVCGMRLDVPGPAFAAPAQPGSAPARAMPPQPGLAPGSPAAPSSAGEQCPQCGAGRTGQFCEACGHNFASGAVRITTAPSYVPGPLGPTSAPRGGSPAAQPGPSSSPAGPGGPPAGPGAASGHGALVGTGQGSVSAVPGSAFTGPGAGPPTAAAAWTAVVTADRAYFDSVIAASGPEAAGLEFPAYCPERRFQLQGTQMRIGRRSVSRGLEPEIDLTGPPADPGVSHLHAVLIAGGDGGWTVFDPGSSNGTQVNGREIAAGSRVRLRDGDRICIGAWTVLTIQAA